ncbi:alpha/beta fold hydrolase [Brevundimonas sp. 2R-24]|uniref:Alpha/beta fold hydrolase n=1 Tax=Peiella sedimenti TaxID=3061083 RepID=A0ABT8SL91_9CAUL|nr:alpha/beta fold hydrolase [Caulobacteraceae bacterium XZ-24]
MPLTEAFAFTAANGRPVEGRLERPDGPARGWALFAHCFACGRDSLAAVRISRGLAARGIGVLRFDFAGLGEAPAPEGFCTDVADVTAAARALASAGMAPALLVGHSLGGAAVIAAAGDTPGVRAVATLGAPFDVAHVLETVNAREGMGRAGGRDIRLSETFVREVERHDQAERLARLDAALMVLHAPRDEVVGVDQAGLIFQAARHPKSFVALDGADHLLTDPADADWTAGLIAAWAERYLA